MVVVIGGARALRFDSDGDEAAIPAGVVPLAAAEEASALEAASASASASASGPKFKSAIALATKNSSGSPEETDLLCPLRCVGAGGPIY